VKDAISHEGQDRGKAVSPLLEVKNLKVHFPVRNGIFSRGNAVVRAVDDVSFQIAPGETVGLVGESGCGKSTLGRAVLRLLEPTTGEVRFDGLDLLALEKRELRAKRRQFQMIFQDPFSTLNPRMTVDQIIGEALDIHGLAADKASRRSRISELLEQVGLDRAHAQRYPHEFSGGQRQRIGIARALAVEPKLIVCDEPVSALDVSVQAQVVNLLQELQSRFGLAYLFIAHDLAVVEHISQRLLVMYLGKVVESGAAQEVIRSPRHPYTKALISAVPSIRPGEHAAKLVLKGELPSPIDPPTGCPFHPRCPLVEEICRREPPPRKDLGNSRSAACHFA
jgi:oligopeptide transport system ATP-binding protein